MTLAFYTQAIANNIPGPYGKNYTYVLFGDTDEPNQYYILPELPTFLPDKNKPSFTTIWYYGPNKEGGVCTFTVALPLPELDNPEIKKLLSQAISQDDKARNRAQELLEMAKANHDGDTAKANDIATSLDLTPEQAQQYYDHFEPKLGYAQFLPSADNLKILAVPLTSARVSVRGFGGPDAFQQWQTNGDTSVVQFTGTYETVPSQLANNAAVISFDLTGDGINLWWHALGGPSFDGSNTPPSYDNGAANSVVAVTYTVSFDGMLPAATATVTLNRDTVIQLITQQHSDTNTWGQTHKWEEVVGKKYEQTIDSSIKIEVPSSSYLNNDNDKKNIEDSLQEWAQAQLEDMLQSQLPTVTLDQLGTGQYDSKELDVIQTQTRTYELSEAINFTRAPQGQLPLVSSLVPADEIGNYFSVINLNDVPYFHLDLVANPPLPAQLQKLNIDSIVINPISYGGQPLRDKTNNQEVSTILFRSSDSALQQVNLKGTFDKKQRNKVQYSYRVTYADGTTPLRKENISLEEGEYYIDFSDKTGLGVLYAVFDGTFLPWGVLENVRIDAKYQNDVDESFLLTSDQKKATLAKPLGRIVDAPLQYRVTYNLSGQSTPLYDPVDGSSYQNVNISTDRQISLQSPFGGTNIYKIELAGGTDSAVISLRYQMPMPSNVSATFEQIISLPDDKGALRTTWTVPAPKTEKATLTITQATTYDNQGNDFQPTIPSRPITSLIKIFPQKIDVF